MIKETIISVKGVEQLASGKKKDGKPWTMYKITAQDDVEYKSFEAMNIGAPYQISYEEEPKKPFTNKEGKYIEPKGFDRFIKRAVFADAPPVETKEAPVSRSEFNALTMRVKVLEDANQPDF